MQMVQWLSQSIDDAFMLTSVCVHMLSMHPCHGSTLMSNMMMMAALCKPACGQKMHAHVLVVVFMSGKEMLSYKC